MSGGSSRNSPTFESFLTLTCSSMLFFLSLLLTTGLLPRSLFSSVTGAGSLLKVASGVPTLLKDISGAVSLLGEGSGAVSLLKESLLTISLGAGFGVSGGGFGFGGVASAPTLVTAKVLGSLLPDMLHRMITRLMGMTVPQVMTRTWCDPGDWLAGRVGEEAGKLGLGGED